MTKSKITERLFNEKSVALFIHIRPDGDTVGSAFALKRALKSFGITAEVFSSDDIPRKFDYLPEVNSVKREMDGEYTAYVAIDNAEVSRIGKFEEAFKKHKNTYNIDHHISNNHYAKYNYVVDRGANAENVYDIIKEASAIIDKETANLLATGIVTDTGGFKHKNVTEETFKVAAELVKCGADFNEITYYTFTLQSQERAKLFGYTMKGIRYFKEGKIAVATVRLKDINESGALPEDTEGFIDFVMGIKGVSIGACVMETEENKFKISLRSHKADVNAVAGEFGGGGHVLASGCKICGEYEEVIDRLQFACSKYIEE